MDVEGPCIFLLAVLLLASSSAQKIKSHRRPGRPRSRHQRPASHPRLPSIGEVRCPWHHHRQWRPVGEGRDAARAAPARDCRPHRRPCVSGRTFPLLNSKEETERWEALYGKFEYKGCWTDFEPNRSTKFREPYHAPDVVPPMPEGEPHIRRAGGYGGGIYCADGAQVSGRSGAVGGRAADELCAGVEARSGSGDAGERIRADGRRALRRQGRDRSRRDRRAAGI